MGPERYRIGEFDFDAGSGELRHSQDGEARRLPPQPSRLLALLAARQGGLVTREEIRAEVWGGQQVDFDNGLHFCVRQVRAALGDSADAPRYVENLPRRGYRLIPPVTRIEATTGAAQPVRRAGRRRAGVVALGIASVAAAYVAWSLLSPPAPTRIAILPFAPPEQATAFGDPRPIADAILEELTAAAGTRAGIVGPTTTETWDASDATMQALAREYDLDYLVNGRFVERDGRPRMLAELIRASDGAHVWVRPYEDLGDPAGIGREIARAIVEELGLARGRGNAGRPFPDRNARDPHGPPSVTAAG